MVLSSIFRFSHLVLDIFLKSRITLNIFSYNARLFIWLLMFVEYVCTFVFLLATVAIWTKCYVFFHAIFWCEFFITLFSRVKLFKLFWYLQYPELKYLYFGFIVDILFWERKKTFMDEGWVQFVTFSLSISCHFKVFRMKALFQIQLKQ